MYYINSYLLNLLVYVGFLDLLKGIANIQLINNIFELLLMFFLVLLTRFITVPIEKLYKKIMSNFFKNKENE